MHLNRRSFNRSMLAALAAFKASRGFGSTKGLDAATVVTASGRRIAAGKLQPTWESLTQYEAPDWFRDAKFGIWAQRHPLDHETYYNVCMSDNGTYV